MSENQTGEEKMEAWGLAKNIHDGAELNLTPEQIVKLKERIGKVYGAAVVGPVYQILDGPAETEGK